jgi:hypothetical protein
MKLAGKHENANAFLEAAKRCSWERLNHQPVTRENEPLLIPEMVNLSFACELYLKAIAEARKIDFRKIHKLDELFDNLLDEDRKALFDLWRENAGTNITGCDYTRIMFRNNLEAISNVFTRFRYADEWAGGVVSLSSSFTMEQFTKLSFFCEKYPGERPPIHEGFLLQFAISLKSYADKVLGKTYNS